MTGVTIDPNIQGGAPCIAGTRIPVATIKRCRKGGWGFERILKEFPSLNGEQIEAALEYEMPAKPRPVEVLPQVAREAWIKGQEARVRLLAPHFAVEVQDLMRAAFDMGHTLSMRR
jgi:uncharacterized protein (DUF433 family)